MSRFRLYFRRQASGLGRYFLEQILQWLCGSIPTIIGISLPGETEETIRQTIVFSKRLPLDIALFHIAAPYPGTPFFFEVLEKGWFRPGTRWEEVDMDRSTVLDYPNLPTERLEYWQKRAFREWAFRPRPFLTLLQSMNS